MTRADNIDHSLARWVGCQNGKSITRNPGPSTPSVDRCLTSSRHLVPAILGIRGAIWNQGTRLPTSRRREGARTSSMSETSEKEQGEATWQTQRNPLASAVAGGYSMSQV